MQVDSYMRRYPIGRIPTHWLLPQILLREVRRSSAGRGCQALEHRYLKHRVTVQHSNFLFQSHL